MQGPDVDDAAMEVMDRPAVWRDATVRAAQDDAMGIAGWGQSESCRGGTAVEPVPRFVGIEDDEPGAFALAERNERYGAVAGRAGPDAADNRRHAAARVIEHRDGGEAAHHARLATDVEEAVLPVDRS